MPFETFVEWNLDADNEPTREHKAEETLVIAIGYGLDPDFVDLSSASVEFRFNATQRRFIGDITQMAEDFSYSTGDPEVAGADESNTVKLTLPADTLAAWRGRSMRVTALVTYDGKTFAAARGLLGVV